MHPERWVRQAGRTATKREQRPTFDITNHLLRDKHRLPDHIYHTGQLMQAAPLRITSLSGLIRWEPVTWARGAISLDASLVNDVNHARLAMLPAA